MGKLYCPGCGKENSTEGARFCAFCGGELAQADKTAEQLLAQLCGGLKDTYINYINWSSDYLASRSAGTILAGMFTGNGDYNNRDEHKVFAADCDKLCGEIVGALQSGGFSPCVSEMLDYVLFDVYSHCGDEAGWMILACEKFYLPILDFLPGGELAQLYPRYKAFRKKKMNLPAQDDMLRHMKRLSKKR